MTAENRHSQEVRPWADLRSEGLLWLINTTVFHPRGYALGMHFDRDGVAVGWSLMGDGSESWAFSKSVDAEIDALFRRVKEMMP